MVYIEGTCKTPFIIIKLKHTNNYERNGNGYFKEVL